MFRFLNYHPPTNGSRKQKQTKTEQNRTKQIKNKWSSCVFILGFSPISCLPVEFYWSINIGDRGWKLHWISIFQNWKYVSYLSLCTFQKSVLTNRTWNVRFYSVLFQFLYDPSHNPQKYRLVQNHHPKVGLCSHMYPWFLLFENLSRKFIGFTTKSSIGSLNSLRSVIETYWGCVLSVWRQSWDFTVL